MSDQKDRFSSGLYRYADVGFEFVAALGLFAMLGYMADTYWRCEPLGMAVGMLVGLVVGIYMVLKRTHRMWHDDAFFGSARKTDQDQNSLSQKDHEAR